VAHDRAFSHRIFYANRALAHDQSAALSQSAMSSQYFIGGYAQRPASAGGEMKLDCSKDMKWLLFESNELQKFAHQKGGTMKKTNVLLACMLIAPLAFAQPSETKNKQTTTKPITVTGETIKMTTEEGVAAIYQPLKTLVVREDRSGNPGRYFLDGPGHVLDLTGNVVQTRIRPGARIRVYYVDTGAARAVDHVVLLD
jgi:hypothetical protein